MFKRVANSLPQTIAALIRMVRVNRVRFENFDGREFVMKERHWLSWLLIGPGNFVFRWRSVPVRVLHTDQWKAWEQAIVPLEPPHHEPTSRSLAIAKIDGVPLARLLGDGGLSSEQKFKLVSLATPALHKFHQNVCNTPEHGSIFLSHGDATVRNVMIDPNSETATWFDFDLRHDLTVKPNARHADDLRALLFSAAHYFPDESLTTLVHLIRHTYDQSEVWQKLAQQICSRWFNLDLFHLAHTRPVNQADIKLVASGSSFDRTQAIMKAVRDIN